MDKEIKAFIDEEYESIYKNLYISLLKGIEQKKEEIRDKRLANSGVEQRILIDYVISLVNANNFKIKNLIEQSQTKFDFEMTAKEIEEYINKSIHSNISYLEKIEKELLEYFSKNKMTSVESCKMKFRNAKLNNEEELEKIKKELILINKNQKISKKKSKKWLSKEAILVGIIIPIVLFILGLIFA